MIIGFKGDVGSGKSTCAKYLVERKGFYEKAFSDPLKEACKPLFLLSDDQLYGNQVAKEEFDPRWFGCSPRVMMQNFGTDYLRNQLDSIMPGIGDNFFVHHFSLWYEVNKETNSKIALSDVRFPNEADYIRRKGGYIIEIIRPDNPFVKKNQTHSSETEKNKITPDFVITNTSQEELYSQLDNLLEKILIQYFN